MQCFSIEKSFTTFSSTRRKKVENTTRSDVLSTKTPPWFWGGGGGGGGGGGDLRDSVTRRAMPAGAYAPGRVSHAGQVNG